MCFRVRTKSNLKVKIANKDIVCWKEGTIRKTKEGDVFVSKYQYFVYKKGKLYKRNCLKKDPFLW